MSSLLSLLTMAIYINGMGNISPQKTWDEKTLFTTPLDYDSNKLTCVEPDYAEFVDANQIRRMSRVIKMGVASASMALKEAGVTLPDGIITATGYGCLEDTGIFLSKMIVNKEQALNPTPFIQSTHNTIGSQIALLLQCQAYNQTFTHGAFSFESALMDCMIQLSESPEKSFLLGGVDEITSISHQIQSRFGIFRKKVISSLNIFNERGPGTINGEGSAFFVLSGIAGTGNIARIDALTTSYKPGLKQLLECVDSFFPTIPLQPDQIDLVLLGKSGDAGNDSILDQITVARFPMSTVGVFKNLCGEYPVATAFACWLSAKILKDGKVPSGILHADNSNPIRNIMILNQYFGTHYSLILLSAC